ncbi:enolase-phosphatase E1 [Scheffersomyces spartinae]|uniref:Enolase-phosphatase E1 n=1 Tax=Scheffersomyces spartinae TaxID=45513 RepID=A0A9P8AG44_9ASCO|nr:enolase-phosphatase E1 [Scheffersomyces spartinae]KAG7191813.1 enolase-phosphatase E1 [Scheffersomyces spartinae]
MNHKVLIFDIEGTVCPITFVKDVLFPYFTGQIPQILSAYKYPLTGNVDTDHDPILDTLLKFPQDTLTSQETLRSHILQLVAADIKEPVLKSLQGIVWKKGYQCGDLKAPVYADAIELITKFTQQPNQKVYIYSSGSIAAQKLLFGHVEDVGDMNQFISGYFDITTAGFKTETSSYTTILKEIFGDGEEEEEESVLFLSDNVKEVKAAKEAGMEGYVVERPGNAPLTDSDRRNFTIINTFEDMV